MLADKRERNLYYALTGNFILFGVSLTIFGAVIPEAIRQYGWSYTSTGIILAASAVGYFSSTFVSGYVIRFLGAKRLIVISLLVEALSIFFFAQSPSIALNVALNFAIGLGHGGTEVVSNYAAIQMERDGTSRLMSFLHAAFCVGAFIGPLGVAGLLKSRLAWELIFRIMGCALVLMGLTFAVLKYPEHCIRIRRDEDNSRTGKDATGRKSRIIPGIGGRFILVGFVLTIFMYVGIELSLSNWSAEYFVDHLGAPSRIGAVMVAVLWAGLLIGRVSISLLYKGKRQELLLVFLALLSGASLTVFLFSSNIVLSGFFIFFAGLGLSGAYPLVMTLVGKNTKNSVAIGYVSTGGGIGSFSFPFILAYIADKTSLHSAFFFCLAVNAAMIIILIGIARQLRKRRGALIPETASDVSPSATAEK